MAGKTAIKIADRDQTGREKTFMANDEILQGVWTG